MPRVINIDPEQLAENGNMTPFELSMAEYLLSLADVFSIPRSLALIYTIIFCSDEPVCFEEVFQKTGLSKSRVSEGLKTLLDNGFVQDVYYHMNRRTFYQPEGSLRGWFTDLVNDKVRPQIKANAGKIEELKEVFKQSGEESELVAGRLESLATWNRKLQRVLPMIVKVIGLTSKSRVARQRGPKTLPTKGKMVSGKELHS
jgi:HTH-type transcriptional regulator, glycine betaine synthesis regulator